ncbi:Copper(I)-binding protein [Lysobacter dokdonensis DS-58]|uniref:Copper(I)-binding protein n=1 Tax=Lysobacter dokdonensis DS-58 TaxID=1300345 RepID=A0A0A2WHZ9_9GAMM|nr:Copper(I)-binding protein [Lysobacter dokdonensis DS-58]
MLAILALLSAVIATPACARGKPDAACVPVVRDGWIRLVPGGMPMHAGFGRFENPCATPATITGAKSASYASVEMHETRLVDGVSRMRAVPTLPVAAKGSAEFKPGGLHMMLMDPTKPLKAGDKVRIEFALQDGRVVRGEFLVR